MTPIAEHLAQRIAATGPLPFSEVMDAALYDPEHGFYAGGGGRAGRRGDFVTSVEVGPLFGAVLAAALDHWWHDFDRPDPFIVVDAGAGPGTLARSIRAAAPECLDAMRYIAVERSAAQREAHPDWVESVANLPSPNPDAVGVVLANELLDNLAFDLAMHEPERGWSEIRVGIADGVLAEVFVPSKSLAPWADPAAVIGSFRMPVCAEAQAWLRSSLRLFGRGRVIVFDYTEQYPTERTDWLRTYRAHESGSHILADLGFCDITANVDRGALDAVRAPDVESKQAAWLQGYGIGAMVEAGKQVWAERAHIGDLAAVRGRSRVAESEALLDTAGLGAFTVLEWAIEPR